MPNFGTLEYDVSRSLEDGKFSKRDQGAVGLARRYSRLIDDAQPAAKYAVHLQGLARALSMLGTLEPLAAAQAEEHLAKIEIALAAHSVASDLGPKLLATLTALGLTPQARAAVTKEGAPSGPVVGDQLGAARQRAR